jgi:hypothetical protein
MLTRAHHLPVLSQINPVHTLTTNFFEIHSNIILPSMTRSSSGLCQVSPQKPCMHFFLLYVPLVPPISFFLILLPR